MKKRIGILVFTLGLILSGINVQASSKENKATINEYVSLFLDEVVEGKSDESIISLKENVEELIQNIKPEDAKKIFNFINQKIEEGKWESEKGLKEAIAEGEKEFDVTLTEEQKDMVLSMVSKIKKLGISPQFVLELAENIYETYGIEIENEISESSQQIVEEVQNKVKEEVDKSIKNYFSDMVTNVKTFFRGIFSK